MTEVILLVWAVSATFLLFRWYILESKRNLEEQIQKVMSIQEQLVEVRKISVSPPDRTEEWRNNAVKHCEEVEKTVMVQYNEMVKSPRNYVTARFFGFPTEYSRENKSIGREAP